MKEMRKKLTIVAETVSNMSVDNTAELHTPFVTEMIL
jgi:hypothetical protein